MENEDVKWKTCAVKFFQMRTKPDGRWNMVDVRWDDWNNVMLKFQYILRNLKIITSV